MGEVLSGRRAVSRLDSANCSCMTCILGRCEGWNGDSCNTKIRRIFQPGRMSNSGVIIIDESKNHQLRRCPFRPCHDGRNAFLRGSVLEANDHDTKGRHRAVRPPEFHQPSSLAQLDAALCGLTSKTLVDVNSVSRRHCVNGFRRSA